MPLFRVKDRWFRILIILLPALLVVYTSGLTNGLTASKLLRFLVSFSSIVLICEGSRYLIYRSRNWWSGRLRILLVVLLGLAWTTACLAISTLLRKYISTGAWDTQGLINSNVIINDRKLMLGLWGYALLNAMVNFPILFIAYDMLYHYAQLRYTEKQKEKLEKEKLKAELQQLKGIVNPHFLFNNLNSLSSLIAESPEQAQDFLDELTKVFRYLLRTNETELVSLSQELIFIQSYYHLLQTRYGQSIVMTTQIDDAYGHLLIPPLTLQLLVENAVKHNRLQKDQPLRIELLSAPGNKLIVVNNLYKKETGVESTGIGHQNINARYRMLNRPGLLIEKTETSFSVVISLVEPEKEAVAAHLPS